MATVIKNPEFENQVLRAILNSAYDLQKLRISTGLRLVANFKQKFGIGVKTEFDDLEDTLSEETEELFSPEPADPHADEVKSNKPKTAKELEAEKKAKEKAFIANLIKNLKVEHRRITDAVANNPKMAIPFTKDGLITAESEIILTSLYFGLLEQENTIMDRAGKYAKRHPLWDFFLKDVKGCGPIMCAVILAYLDIYRAHSAASFHYRAGLDVVVDENGVAKGRGLYKAHLVEKTYIDKDGKQKTKMSISYNPTLKSRLLAVLGSSFIKQTDSPYRQIYINYKHRLENSYKAQWRNTTKIHRHKAAVRYMIKIFLVDLYNKWCELEGIVPTPAYAVRMLGAPEHKGLHTPESVKEQWDYWDARNRPIYEKEMAEKEEAEKLLPPVLNQLEDDIEDSDDPFNVT